MLSFPTPSVFQASKTFFTYGIMGHIDPNQSPSKNKPWTTIQSLDFIHKVDLVLPEEHLELVQEILLAGRTAPEFKRVVMPLAQILDDAFLTQYIKLGNVLMLSQGRPGHDNVFALRGGKLTMFLDRETYERSGLQGKPHGAKGNRGLKPRWIVEVDLRADSMWPTKKGFKRVLYAAKNVLNAHITWLFCNMSSTPDPDPLEAHQPTKLLPHVEISESLTVMMPSLKPPTSLIDATDRVDADEFATDIYEWISLLRLQSPRVEVGDQIDPYLSRYQVPGEAEQQQAAKLSKISWQGFISPTWAREMLIAILVALPSNSWVSWSVSTFPSSKGLAGDGVDLTIMRLPKSPKDYLMWEVRTHE